MSLDKRVSVSDLTLGVAHFVTLHSYRLQCNAVVCNCDIHGHCQYELAVCRALRGLPVGFLLLRYSVLFTVESLSLLYLLVIS